MALVMLPCELPWWLVVQRKLTTIETTNDLDQIIEAMQKIHDLCNISLDPDEDQLDNSVMDGLKNFILNDFDQAERDHFLNNTLNTLCVCAKNLKINRPPRGMEFSLQQNLDGVEINNDFVASLLANAFFSTYPKRTKKTHPTLQDFNFTYFFKELTSNIQKSKFRSFLYYFDCYSNGILSEDDGKLKISRKVMSGKQWLTIEDWLESTIPLCSLEVKHEGKIENAADGVTQTIFTKANVGLNVLKKSHNQESDFFFMHPQLLIILLYAEQLEDNEALLIENLHQVSRIVDPKNKAIFEKLEKPKKKTVLCMDPESYLEYPIDQFEEDNFLRELNKCLLAFRQNSQIPITTAKTLNGKRANNMRRGRLSPVQETPMVLIKQATAHSSSSPQTTLSSFSSQINSHANGGDHEENGVTKRRSWLNLPKNLKQNHNGSSDEQKRRGRFIVLGSSGECLPINRPVSGALKVPKSAEKSFKRNSFYSSCDDPNSDVSDDEDEFYSARNSLNEGDDDSDEEFVEGQRYSIELETPENRFHFAKQLKDALKIENGYTESTDESSNSLEDHYNVDISVTGSKVHDQNIRVKRGTSCGFILDDEDNEITDGEDSLLDRLKYLDTKQKKILMRNDTNDSSRYSFDSDMSSELEEIYDQLNKWLNDPIDGKRNLDSRDQAVLKFADSLLKRTLSESFAGQSMEDCISTSDEESCIQQKRHKMITNFRSLSLELAKHKHQITAKLMSQLLKRQPVHPVSNLRPVATGNWGCGSSDMGDFQMKLLIQWLAASVGNIPTLIYYTSTNSNLAKLDTLVRVLLDRNWTVGELASTTLFYAKNILNNPINYNKNSSSFFDKLIACERN